MTSHRPQLLTESLDRRTLRLAAGRNASLSFADVLRLWRTDPSFRQAFTLKLAEAPFEAFRWEAPPITRHGLDRAFECVVIDSPGLIGAVDPLTFADYYTGEGAGVVAFDNLGGDARLVVPSPRTAVEAYAHLASFVRRAPSEQHHALWQAVAQEVEARVSNDPLWVSTAGGGVAWLHVRLDSRPKYYRHAPYRDERPGSGRS